jgi:hypothetical protein
MLLLIIIGFVSFIIYKKSRKNKEQELDGDIKKAQNGVLKLLGTVKTSSAVKG